MGAFALQCVSQVTARAGSGNVVGVEHPLSVPRIVTQQDFLDARSVVPPSVSTASWHNYEQSVEQMMMAARHVLSRVVNGGAGDGAGDGAGETGD